MRTKNLLKWKPEGGFPGLAAVLPSFGMAFGMAAVPLSFCLAFAACDSPVSIGSDSGSGDTDAPGVSYDGDEGDDWFAAMLTDLGVEMKMTPPLDPKGNPLPSGYNPLRAAPLGALDTTGPSAGASVRSSGGFSGGIKQSLRSAAKESDFDSGGGRVSYHPLYEIWLGGVNHTDDGSGRKSILYDDLKGAWPNNRIAGFRALNSDQTGEAWLEYPKKAVGADFDGDGKAEALIAVADRAKKEIALRLGKGDASGFSKEIGRFAYPGDLAAELPGDNGNSKSGSGWGSETEFLGMDMAAGDFDGDGHAEAILVVAGYVFLVDNIGTRLSPACTLLRSYGITERPADRWQFVSVAVADYDQDGYDDWVEAVATSSDNSSNRKTATFAIYNGRTRTAFNKENSFGDVKVPGDEREIRSVNVVTGDFDGDGLPETAFCGRKAEAGEYRLYILDTDMDENSKPVFAFLPDVMEIGWKGTGTPRWGSLIPALAAGDMNGDGRDEIFAVSKVFGADAYGRVNELYSQRNPGRKDPGNNTMYDLAVCGDINGDLKADVLYYDWEGRVCCISADDSGIYRYRILTDVSYPRKANRERGMALALANTDDDSYIVQYKAHEVLYTEPVVVAVLASPPYFGDIDYPVNIDFHHTTYGKTEGTGERNKYSHALETKASMSFHPNKTRLIFETDLAGGTTWGFANAREVTSYMSYSAAIGEDTVVFTSIPYDVYSYTVIKAPAGNADGEDGAEVKAGDTLHFDLPRPAGTYNQSLAYYNEHNGNYPDVTVPHRVGDPFSYTKYKEMVNLKSKNGGRGLYTTSTVEHTGIGDRGWNSQSTSEVSSAEKDFEWNAGIAVGGIQEKPPTKKLHGKIRLISRTGYRYRNLVTTRISEGLFIEGEVPDIPGKDINDDHRLFRWGLLMYPFVSSAAGEEQAFNYVTYWVDEDKR